jgi:hypothetical protein
MITICRIVVIYLQSGCRAALKSHGARCLGHAAAFNLIYNFMYPYIPLFKTSNACKTTIHGRSTVPISKCQTDPCRLLMVYIRHIEPSINGIFDVANPRKRGKATMIKVLAASGLRVGRGVVLSISELCIAATRLFRVSVPSSSGDRKENTTDAISLQTQFCFVLPPFLLFSPHILASETLEMLLKLYILANFAISSLAGTVGKGGPCSGSRDHLDSNSHKFVTDCSDHYYCSAPQNGTCVPKACRRDEYPFGYSDQDALPPMCPQGTFCPDEGSGCRAQVAVGQGCQMNRDDQCAPALNWRELQSDENWFGSICLKSVCM